MAFTHQIKDDPILTFKDEFRILFVGQAGPRKGFIDLLAAFDGFRHLKKQLILIGSMSSEASTLLGRRDCSNITVLGRVSNDQLPFHYNNSSVFVLPSIEEGFGMVIGEAMACGCPVIATTNTGASEMISNGTDGFIVPIRSPVDISDRLQLLADDSSLLNSMRKAAYEKMKNFGGWNTYGEKWEYVLNNINK